MNRNMKLFEGNYTHENILPKDGLVLYYGTVLSKPEADKYYQQLLQNIAWKHDEAVIYGKRIVTKRKVAWYGSEPFAYTYSKTTKYALPWTAELQALKTLVEAITHETYNSCLLNLYHNGEEGMSWHRDAEKDLKKDGAIASLSLGAPRRFDFKHIQTGEQRSLILEHGSLLVMAGPTQTYWLHRLPVTKKVTTPRINLTFRTIE